MAKNSFFCLEIAEKNRCTILNCRVRPSPRRNQADAEYERDCVEQDAGRQCRHKASIQHNIIWYMHNSAFETIRVPSPRRSTYIHTGGEMTEESGFRVLIEKEGRGCYT